MATQVIDTETAQEFMRETLEKVSASELAETSSRLDRKQQLFSELLSPERLARADRDDLRVVLRHTFSTRRKADAILDGIGPDRLAEEFERLLRGSDPLPERLESTTEFLAAFPSASFDLPSELLHFTDPDHYWLWARWMWNPRTETGSLPLVVDEEFDLGDGDVGPTYLLVGEATAFVSETGRAAGLTTFGSRSSPFGIDVFLACVYAIYMYTVLRLRMTQEFNRIVPEQSELIRRLLGVHHMEA